MLVIQKSASYSLRAVKEHVNRYYNHLFPWDEFFRWFCYGYAGKFHKREFAFILVYCNIFVRHKSFVNDKGLKAFVMRQFAAKIDAGAYYLDRPGSHELRQTTEKELVFDIDLSDYDDVRLCCQKTAMCSKCWMFAVAACKILDAILREDYGWKLILWVFSGRRGIHCWVCDESARNMSDEQRKQFVAILNLKIGHKGTARNIQLESKTLSHHVRRSYDLVKHLFLPTCVREQRILCTVNGVATFLSLLPEFCRAEVKSQMGHFQTSELRWKQFNKYYKDQKRSKSAVWKERPHLIEEIVLWYLYPRIDQNVTTSRQHLIKVPFSLHLENKVVCTPFDPKTVETFDIDGVPCVFQFVDAAVMIKETGTRDRWIDPTAEKQIDNFEKSLKVFRAFVKDVEEALTQRPLIDVEARKRNAHGSQELVDAQKVAVESASQGAEENATME